MELNVHFCYVCDKMLGRNPVGRSVHRKKCSIKRERERNGNVR